jgi:hypothetical protein
MNEIYDCVEFLRISYNDVMSMPTWHRRYFMEKKRIQNRVDNDQIMNQAPKSKGSNTRSVTGQELKNNIGKYQ